MAEIISSEFKAYDEKLNLKLDQLYIEKDGKYYKLSDLVIFVDNSSKDYRAIRSYDDFKKNLADSGTKGVYLKNPDGTRSNTQVKRSEVVSVVDGKTVYSGVYTRDLTVPTQYESTSILSVGESIYHGLKRVHNVNGHVGFDLNASRYVLVKLDGDANYTFLRVNQIGYYEGGSFVSLVGKRIGEIRDKNLFTTSGKRVGSIYTEKTFTFGRAIAQEQIDPDTFTRSMYEFDADGNVVMETVGGVARPKMTSQPIDRIYSDHTFRKVDGQAKLEVRNYQKSAKGEGKSIQVVFKGDNAPTMVDIDLLYEMDEVGKASKKLKADTFKTRADVNKLIGKALLVKVSEGNYRETEPLTLEQAVFTYTIQKQRIETTSPEHIMADNAMLMLEDGRYIKEQTAVRPIAYEFTDDERYDALYVKYTDSEGKEQGIIVPKDTFSASPTRNINGIVMHVKNAFRIKKSTKPLKECDVIQTSNRPGQKYHDCRALKSPRYEAGVTKTTDLGVTDEQINGLVAEMIEAYKKGEYQLEEVIDDLGRFVKLDDRHKRYIEADYRYETDYANGADHYNFLKMNPLRYDAKKDELIGGPHFDAAAANKEGFKVWGDWAARFAGAATTIPGILVLAAIPALAVTLGVAAVGSAIGIPIVNAIRAYRHNHRQYKYRDKTEYNRKQTTKQVERELQAMYDQVKEDIAAIDANASLTDEQKKAQKEVVKRKFLDKFSQVEQTMDSLHTSKYYSEFKVVDGVAQVNEGNAPLMSAYREMMADLKKRIAKLEKQAKKDPSKQAELDNLKAEYEGKLQYYTSQGQVTPMDESVTTLENKAHSMRGLVLAKFFGERLADEEEMTLEEERRALDCMEYADGIEFDPRLKKDERKGLDRAVIEEREDKIEKAVIKLKKDKLISKSTETGYEAEVVESKVAKIDEKHRDEEHRDEEHKEEKVKVPEIKKIKLSEKELENLLNAVNKLKRLDDLKFGADEDLTDDYDREIDKLISYIKDRWHLIKRARNSTKYGTVYKKYNEQMIEAYKYVEKRMAGLDLAKGWEII